jgi:Domain of unknown function (DUF4145)
MQYKLNVEVGSAKAATVSFRCPHCRHAGAFNGLPDCKDVSWQERKSKGDRVSVTAYTAGVRRCPNGECQSLVFVILSGGRLSQSFPPEVIDFDSTSLPDPILASLEEAIKAHSAGCFKASALMIRRTLEEVCKDKNATGRDLKARLASLSGSIVVPQELLDAADELRLLGNDAAHVEAKAYDAIGPDEAALAIELAKELLKAVYQYASLVAKLKALKKP